MAVERPRSGASAGTTGDSCDAVKAAKRLAAGPAAPTHGTFISMFRKLKVALGAGSATVDAILSVAAVHPGERVNGFVNVSGGQIEQEIERITVALETVVEVESGDSECSSNRDLRDPAGRRAR